MDRRGMGVAI
uniref:Uncharacterized protein n=1 Tax=Arundo donax TaxID=35708 RepID=A0A0A9FW97_ARUDO